jgi:Icc-related predicted phosphoesterase
MKIDCISDLHGDLPDLEGGDLLIVAGDLTARDQLREYEAFYNWLKKQNYRMKIVVAGNHDNFLTHCISTGKAEELGISDELEGHVYLCDSGIEFEGLKIWGAPWTPIFKGIHPKCKAFMLTEFELAGQWGLIPTDTDILITHGPPFGVMDKTSRGEHVGSKSLSHRLLDLKLKAHVFGHIHEGYGQEYQGYSSIDVNDPNPKPFGHLSVNCSLMNQDYETVNKPVRIEI